MVERCEDEKLLDNGFGVFFPSSLTQCVSILERRHGVLLDFYGMRAHL